MVVQGEEAEAGRGGGFTANHFGYLVTYTMSCPLDIGSIFKSNTECYAASKAGKKTPLYLQGIVNRDRAVEIFPGNHGQSLEVGSEGYRRQIVSHVLSDCAPGDVVVVTQLPL